MKGCKVGYIRVSSEDQNPERQLDGLEMQHNFLDRVSGRNMERPKLEEMMRFIRIGDEVYVHSMDRLARNLSDLLSLVKQITDKGASVHFVKENLIFNGEENAISKLMLSIMGAVAEFERSLIKERQLEGIRLAKKKGIYKGRKPCLTPEEVDSLRIDLMRMKRTDAARKYGISKTSVYKYLNLESQSTSSSQTVL